MAGETQICLARHGKVAQLSRNGGRAAVATGCASRNGAGLDEGEAKENVRAGGAHEEVGRANEKRSGEQHEEVVMGSEMGVDVRGEEGRGRLKKDAVHAEVVRATAIQVACDALRRPCRGGWDYGYACPDSPFLDLYRGEGA